MNSGKVPIWYWLVSAVALVWNALGVMVYLQQAFMSVEDFRNLEPPRDCRFCGVRIVAASEKTGSAYFHTFIRGGSRAIHRFLSGRILGGTCRSSHFDARFGTGGRFRPYILCPSLRASKST